MKKVLYFLMLILLIGNVSLFAQGVTDATVEGKVINNTGKAIPGATIILTHTPTGTEYTLMTREDGTFSIPNVKIGGPYILVAKFMGYQDAVSENIFLSLNQTYTANVKLYPETQNLEEVKIIYDRSDEMNSGKTGSVTFVNSKQIRMMPTISGSQQDLTRLTPESNGYSFGGRNNLYNNFSLDGSIFNNSFGLDYATPGGQADAQPVSVEAIDQMQVSLAPFNVKEGGFTGAGINAVTKSGTNDFKFMLYEYFRNNKMIGSKVGDVVSENFDYLNNRYGINIGGPIIKNKLFFFVNYEGVRQNRMAHGFVADDGTNSGDNVTSVSKTDIEAVRQHLIDAWGYDPGAFEGYNHKKKNDKLLLKLDWNAGKKTKIKLRYNYLNAFNDVLPHPEAVGGRGPTSFRLPFENSSYNINNKINSIVGEVNTLFSSKLSNNILIGYTAFRDERTPKSVPFPVIDILNSNGQVAITAGSEMFSTHNILNQDVYQFTDNLNYYLKKHTITAGVNYEQFNFENSFNLFYYPWVTAFSVQDFLDDNVVTFVGPPTNPSNVNQVIDSLNTHVPFNWAYLDVAQLGVYIQDKYNISDKLNMTLGLRVDLPIYLSKIEEDPNITGFNGWVDENGDAAKVDPSKFPKNNFLWSPRIGFNFDVKGDNTLKIRGGSGIFSGRIPFVWLGNQASNAKLFPGYTFQINATSEDFHFPQAWKSDLAVDALVGNGWKFSVEGIFSKDLNAVVHRNYNMLPPTGTLSGADNRAIFNGFNEVNIYSSSPDAIGFLDAGAIVLDNTEKGYQYTLTGKLTKNFAFGINLFAAYTYTKSMDYTSIPAEIAADAFQRNPVAGNPNMPMFANSRYGLKHRIITAVNYTVEYGKSATTFSFFYEGGVGNRYSYTYAGDLNQDAIINNDLIYIPANQSEIHFGTVIGGVGTEAVNANAQWTALNAFIEQDPYLSTHRGQIAERHGSMLPWFNSIDFRLLQDFTIKTGNKNHAMQLTFDIMNIGNLLNSKWGVRQLATTWNPITVNGLDSNNVPYFSFDTNLKKTYIDDVSLASKWQMQLGLKYYFNK